MSINFNAEARFVPASTLANEMFFPLGYIERMTVIVDPYPLRASNWAVVPSPERVAKLALLRAQLSRAKLQRNKHLIADVGKQLLQLVRLPA